MLSNFNYITVGQQVKICLTSKILKSYAEKKPQLLTSSLCYYSYFSPLLELQERKGTEGKVVKPKYYAMARERGL